MKNKALTSEFVFIHTTLTEGKLSYKLRFPFNEFVDDKILMTQVVKQYEPKQTIANQSLLEYDNENIQSETLKSYEPSQSQKNVKLAKNFASLLQIGDA